MIFLVPWYQQTPGVGGVQPTGTELIRNDRKCYQERILNIGETGG